MTIDQQPRSPRTFSDRLGRRWDVTLTLGAARRIDETDFARYTSTTFSILRPDGEHNAFFQECIINPCLLFAVIFQVVKPQIRALLNIDPYDPALLARAEEMWVDGLDHQAIQAARAQFWEALQDFFPEWRTVLSVCWRQNEKGRQLLEQGLTRRVLDSEAILEKLVTREITEALTALGGGLTEMELEARIAAVKTAGEQSGTSLASFDSPPSKSSAA